MKYPLVVLAFVLATTHRLPAPIREIEETPKPAAPTKAKAQPKTPGKPTSQNGMQSHSVTVVLTDNTRAAILYLKNYEGKPFSDVRTSEIVEQLRQALSTRFSNVSISESNSSTYRSGQLTMLFDLQAHVASVSFTANTVSFIATFKDGGRTLQTISASGKSTVPYPAFSNEFSKAVQQAFVDFSQKIRAVR